MSLNAQAFIRKSASLLFKWVTQDHENCVPLGLYLTATSLAVHGGVLIAGVSRFPIEQANPGNPSMGRPVK
jgi:hypothetical protein